MGGFSIGELDLNCEQVSRENAAETYVLRIEYERGSDANVDRIELDVDSRIEVTEDVVADAMREWRSASGGEFVRSFAVYERIDCRRGGPTDETRERWMTGGAEATDVDDDPSTEQAAQLVESVGFSPGDHVAYHVQGPESSVYGHVAEGRVEKAPPWTKGAPGREERIVDSAVLERGGDTKAIPLEWIVGTTDDDEIAAQVDRAYDDG